MSSFSPIRPNHSRPPMAGIGLLQRGSRRHPLVRRFVYVGSLQLLRFALVLRRLGRIVEARMVLRLSQWLFMAATGLRDYLP